MGKGKLGRYCEQAKANTGPTPSRAATFAPKRKKKNLGGSAGENSMVKQAQRNYIGSYISGDLGGVQVGNKSLQKFYSNPGFKMPKIS